MEDGTSSSSSSRSDNTNGGGSGGGADEEGPVPGYRPFTEHGRVTHPSDGSTWFTMAAVAPAATEEEKEAGPYRVFLGACVRACVHACMHGLYGLADELLLCLELSVE